MARIMEVASVRLTDEEKEFIERLIAAGKFRSVSETLKAGLHELIRKESIRDLPWKTRMETRRHFAARERRIRGLEELHNEEV
jgi:Arc/MetJ-type ribon-helix-helix transcriptional regulator